MKLLINNRTLLTINKREYDKRAPEGSQVVTDTEARYLDLMLDPGSTWTEQNIISFRKLINSREHNHILGVFQGVTENSLTEDGTEWRITAEQTQKGIDYLRKTLFKANGQLRDTELVRSTQSELIEAVRDFKSFSFVDLVDLVQRNWPAYTAVYRIHTNSGLTVDYTYTQCGTGYRGGIFEVVRVDRSEQVECAMCTSFLTSEESNDCENTESICRQCHLKLV